MYVYADIHTGVWQWLQTAVNSLILEGKIIQNAITVDEVYQHAA